MKVWRDLEIGEEVKSGDRFVSHMGCWKFIGSENEHLHWDISESSRIHQRLVGEQGGVGDMGGCGN